MDEALRARLVQAMADTIIAHADELTAMDAAMGDGDHGINMKRGFEAVLAKRDEIAVKALPNAAQELGRTLVMTVGGSSGAIFGTAFMAAGKSLPDAPGRDDVLAALDASIAAVRARGKAEVGHKTMLDVLAPVADAMRAGRDDIPGVAREAAEATAAMQAIRGRASFTGERSVGHADPGARSAALLIEAICAVVGERS